MGHDQLIWVNKMWMGHVGHGSVPWNTKQFQCVQMREDCSKRLRAQHENRRAAMFVDEDCVDSIGRSIVDDHRTRDCLCGESRPVSYEGWCSLTALICSWRRQSCSRLCYAQWRSFRSRLSDVGAMKLGKQFVQQLSALFCNLWKLVFDMP